MHDKQAIQAQAGRGELASCQPPAAGLTGTAPSNTVPSNCNTESGTRILRTGIDSLYVSYPGELYTEAGIRLAEYKSLAQSPDPQTAALAQMELGTHVFEVGDKGRSIYPYVLRDNWFQLQVSKPEAINKPLAFALIASGLLTTQPLPFILSDLDDCINDLGKTDGDTKISRLDLCCDFLSDYPLDQVRELQWVTRARNIDRHYDSRQFTGFSIGMGGDLSARLYNKTIEMRKNPRPYLEEIWRKAGWNGLDPVWRLEFQFRRQVLRQFDIATTSTLDTGLAGLWAYASSQWLRLAEPSPTDTTQSRWPTAAVWEILQQAPWIGDPDLPRINIDKTRIPSDKTLFENGLSGITSFMAVHGHSLVEDGVKAFMAGAWSYHEGRKHFTDSDLQDYVIQKVREKQKRMNTAINVPLTPNSHPADQAVARAYRKARDGE